MSYYTTAYRPSVTPHAVEVDRLAQKIKVMERTLTELPPTKAEARLNAAEAVIKETEQAAKKLAKTKKEKKKLKLLFHFLAKIKAILKNLRKQKTAKPKVKLSFKRRIKLLYRRFKRALANLLKRVKWPVRVAVRFILYPMYYVLDFLAGGTHFKDALALIDVTQKTLKEGEKKARAEAEAINKCADMWANVLARALLLKHKYFLYKKLESSAYLTPAMQQTMEDIEKEAEQSTSKALLQAIEEDTPPLIPDHHVPEECGNTISLIKGAQKLGFLKPGEVSPNLPIEAALTQMEDIMDTIALLRAEQDLNRLKIHSSTVSSEEAGKIKKLVNKIKKALRKVLALLKHAPAQTGLKALNVLLRLKDLVIALASGAKSNVTKLKKKLLEAVKSYQQKKATAAEEELTYAERFYKRLANSKWQERIINWYKKALAVLSKASREARAGAPLIALLGLILVVLDFLLGEASIAEIAESLAKGKPLPLTRKLGKSSKHEQKEMCQNLTNEIKKKYVYDLVRYELTQQQDLIPGAKEVLQKVRPVKSPPKLLPQVQQLKGLCSNKLLQKALRRMSSYPEKVRKLVAEEPEAVLELLKRKDVQTIIDIL